MTNANNNNGNNNMMNDAVDTLACVTMDDLKAMDYDTLKAMKENMNYFMAMLTTVTAAKKAEKDAQEETNKHVMEREAKFAAKQNVNATVDTFDTLEAKDKNAILGLGKLYHHARRSNNFAGMEMMKTKILEQLCDLNIGNQYVVGHVIHLAK
jgi:kynurenine formamidase